MLHEALQKQLIEQGRAFTTGYRPNDLYDEDFQSGQNKETSFYKFVEEQGL